MIHQFTIDYRLLELIPDGKEFTKMEAALWLAMNEGDHHVRTLANKFNWSRTKIEHFILWLHREKLFEVMESNGKQNFVCLFKKATQKATSMQNQTAFANGGKPAKSHPEVTEEDEKVFVAYTAWMVKNANRVLKMKQPLTAYQVKMLREDFSREVIQKTLLAMQNRGDLHRKYVSAYLTANNWCKTESQNSK